MQKEELEKLRLKADVFKAMGHPIRLGIIELLSKGELCVCEIVEYVGTDISNVSRHLSILKRNGIVRDRKVGLKVFYELAMPCAIDFTRCVETSLSNLLESRKTTMGRVA